MLEQIRPRRFESQTPGLTHASIELLKAAERDAGEIVASARGDVQRIVLKAQQELLALNAQVRTTINRFEGGREGGLIEGSLVLREARRELEALSAEPRPLNVVPAESAGQASLAPRRPTLSPYEMDNARVRVKLPARIARAAKAVPLVSAILVVGLAVGIWGWSHGWRIMTMPGSEPTVSATPENPAPPDDRASEATGMIGRTPANAGAVRVPDRPRPPVDDAKSSRPSAPPATKQFAAAPSGASGAARDELIGVAERWLDAYYLKDSSRLAALSTPTMTLSDERTPDDRLPAGLAGVRRSLSDATVQVFGSDAILTAKLSERDAGGRESSGFISQMWTRRGGAWQVTDVRIVSAAAVARAFRR